jgi:hypothetical protein
MGLAAATQFGSSDDPDLRPLFQHALESIQPKGSFACVNETDFVDPGIYIHQVGNIRLPLGIEEAIAIDSASHQAPLGPGSRTIVDLKVQNTWELNAGQFKLQNPLWSEYLDGAVTLVKDGLGMQGTSVVAHLDKMLLYGPGAHSRKQTGYHC